MKVGDQPVDDSELVRRVDKDVRLPLPDLQFAALRRRFERPRRRRSHGDDFLAGGLALTDSVHGFGWDTAPFGVHLVFRWVSGLHRFERAQTNVQRHPGGLNAFRLKTIKQRLREMEPGGRRRD